MCYLFCAYKNVLIFRSSAETMAILKTKRIPRLQKTDSSDDKTAKRHKGDSFDSCK